RRYPGTQLLLQRTHLVGGLGKLPAETIGLPDLKLVTKTDERDFVLDPGMGLQRLGKTDAPLAVDLQSLARTVKRGAELLALLRIRRKPFDQRFDLRHQGVAPRIDRRHIERRITIETVEPVAREDCPVRRRDRYSPLGVEPQRGVRH